MDVHFEPGVAFFVDASSRISEYTFLRIHIRCLHTSVKEPQDYVWHVLTLCYPCFVNCLIGLNICTRNWRNVQLQVLVPQAFVMQISTPERNIVGMGMYAYQYNEYRDCGLGVIRGGG